MQPHVEDRLAGLSGRERAQLLAELRAVRRRRAEEERIAPVPRDEPLPLSYAQQRLWFLEEWGEGQAGYNSPLALRLRGPLDAELLRSALAAVVARHETLRTRYVATADGPRQVVEPAREPKLRHVDLTAVPEARRDEEIQALADAEARRPFDLAAGTMLRATLARVAVDDHALVLAMHHIATDGWSTERLIEELAECYLAGAAGREPVLRELPVQYADYAVWQRGRVENDAAGLLAYWRERLAGLPTLEFPTDRPRPANPTWAGDVVMGVLPAPLHRDLEAFAEAERTRLLPVLVAGLSALMTRYTGQEDVPLGSVFSGRSRTEVDPLIGYFANTVVLRTSTAGEPTFRELVARASEAVFDAHRHQDLPFEQVVSALSPDRDPSRNPLFQFAIYPIGKKLDTMRMGDIELTGVPLHMGASKFDCTVGISERPDGGGIELMTEYATELFDRATIERLLGHLRRLLEAALARPDAPVGELDVLTAEERHELVVRANDTAVDLPPSAGVHAEFAEWARRTPDAIALVHNGVEIGYADLDRRANGVAQRLRALGVGPGSLVGVCLSRSPRLVAGLLGVLKAGAAYVPLDPAYPAARLGHVLADADLSVVLVDEAGREVIDRAGVSLATAPRLLELGGSDEPADEPPPAGTDEHSLAYLIYTSGSTGRPKGVMVEHGQLLNLFTGLDERLGADRGTWLATSSVSFDMSGVELFWTLTRGFTVVLADGRPHELLGTDRRAGRKPVDFGLFYFASDDGPSDDHYRLLIEGAKFADRNGFSAVWTPERHFQEFGGLFPSPSVTAAAVAMVTERVSVRAGSVVLPLHHPVRVAEEWSVVDNLSHGRAGVAFASGWMPDDFVFAPDDYADRKQVMIDAIATVRKLWAGEKATFRGGHGKDVEVGIRPRPVQDEIPVWLSSGGSDSTFRAAGELGVNILTHLLGQDLDELERLIDVYRAAYREHHGEGGRVTLMLHAFVDPDREKVLRTVREPFKNYLRTSLGLAKILGQRMGMDFDPRTITKDDLDALLDHAFDRYVGSSGLFGTPEECLALVDELGAIGVDEVACLVDFGVGTDDVLASLAHLNTVRERNQRPQAPGDERPTWAELVRRHGVTHFQCTPAMAQLLADDEDAADAMTGLRRLLVGGEALPTGLARRLRELTGDALHNMYGPTETTVWSTTTPADGTDDDLVTASLGRPIANTEVYVLDAHRRLVPAGVPGELYIGGLGVTRGYYRRAELTAERFVPNPFGPSPRLYRTGDVVRRLADGRLEFLGRADHQVKVRGFRVELGEVENVLREHPDVAGAVVVAKGEIGAQHLVAYVVGASAPDAEGLRAFTAGRLPEYMVPARWVRLDEFPLNPNGKVDRSKLPDPAAEAGPVSQPPRTPFERELAKVWAEVLGVAEIGIHDNFFHLGGHSIAVIRVVDLATRRGLAITARQLFAHQTIAQLAASVGTDEPGSGTLVRLTADGSEPPLFLVHSSTGNTVPYVPLARLLGADRACFGVDADEMVPGAQVESIDVLAERYVAAVREVQPSGPYHLVGWSLGGGLAWAMAARLRAAGEAVELLALLDTQPPTGLDEPLGHAEAVCAFAESFSLSVGAGRVVPDVTRLRGLGHEEQYSAVLGELAGAGLIRAEERDHVLGRARMFVALTIAASVWSAPEYDGDVDLLVAESGDEHWLRDGWQPYAGTLRVQRVPGDHFGLLRPGNVEVLAGKLREVLTKS
ncbi:MupA/Atu3671 family FMN-dependent luciferase-like monooxygenase [Amycolatopsis sp. NPDC049253]|uniref:MupA/Atu3671 family FMN-dependent luciferase-like monooxygenase n=1 Tax=Amycolatopsis sp. NPDC049253 TaxID=3155274 RepID=UPI0034262AE9